jgi:hypothetical protein
MPGAPTPPESPESPLPAGAGLCGICAHCRKIQSRRGSTFLLCERSRNDPRYPRYPPLPVFRCPGFEPGTPWTLEHDE